MIPKQSPRDHAWHDLRGCAILRGGLLLAGLLGALLLSRRFLGRHNILLKPRDKGVPSHVTTDFPFPDAYSIGCFVNKAVVQDNSLRFRHGPYVGFSIPRLSLPKTPSALWRNDLRHLVAMGFSHTIADVSWRTEGWRMGVFRILAMLVRAFFGNRANVAAENLTLRHQLTILQRSVKQPKIRRRDRLFWVWLARLWSGWQSVLLIVQPATVVRWHHQGFRLYWRCKSRKKTGRPRIDRQFQDLIRRMCQENPLWGAPRIQSELALLGHDVAESTVAKYMDRISPSHLRRPGALF